MTYNSEIITQNYRLVNVISDLLISRERLVFVYTIYILLEYHDFTVETEVITISHKETYLNGNVACELGYFEVGDECV